MVVKLSVFGYHSANSGAKRADVQSKDLLRRLHVAAAAYGLAKIGCQLSFRFNKFLRDCLELSD